SQYHSLQLNLEKRFSKGMTILANYTWSKSYDDLPFAAGAGGPADGNSLVYPWYFPNATAQDRGPSDFDVRHRLGVTYVWRLGTPGCSRTSRCTSAGGCSSARSSSTCSTA